MSSPTVISASGGNQFLRGYLQIYIQYQPIHVSADCNDFTCNYRAFFDVFKSLTYIASVSVYPECQCL